MAGLEPAMENWDLNRLNQRLIDHGGGRRRQDGKAGQKQDKQKAAGPVHGGTSQTDPVRLAGTA